MDKNKLNKNLSSVNVLALAFGCIIGWGAFVMPGDRLLKSGGTLGTSIGFLISAVVMIIIAINYRL